MNVLWSEKLCVCKKIESLKIHVIGDWLICAYSPPDSYKIHFSTMDKGLIMDNMLIMDMHRSSTDH